MSVSVTESPAVPRVLRVALPMMYASTVSMASSFVVLALLSNLGDESLYVRSVYTPFAFLFMAVNSALTVTLQVRVARAAGAGRTAEIPVLTGALLRVGLSVYAVLCVLVLALGQALARGLGVEAGAVRPFTHFFVEMTLVTALGFVGELAAAVLRGSGGTLASAVLLSGNLVLSLCGFALLSPALGLTALPVAMTAAVAVELVAGIVILHRRGLWTRTSVTGWAPVLPSVLRIGIPVGASSLILFVTNLVFLRVLQPHGIQAVEGFTFANTLATALIVPAIGFGAGVAIVMNHHAERPPVALAVFRRGLRLAAYGYGVVTLAVVVGGVALVDLLIANPYAADYMRITGPSVGCTGMILVALTTLEHTGNGIVALGMNTLFFGLMILTGAWVAAYGDSVSGFYWTLSLFNVAGVVTGLPTAWWLLRRRIGRGI